MANKSNVIRTILDAEPRRKAYYQKLRANPHLTAKSVFDIMTIEEALAAEARNAVIRKGIFDTPAVPSLVTLQRKRLPQPASLPKLNFRRPKGRANDGGPVKS